MGRKARPGQMAGNGTTIGNNSKLTLTVVIMLIGMVASAAAIIYGLQGNVQAHTANVDVHHCTSDLDATYARRELMEQQYREIIRRLEEIDRKLDR